MQKVRVNNPEKLDTLMSRDMLDKEARLKLVHFLEQLEMSVFTANQEVIKRKIPNLNRDAFMRLATRVAEQRADYLAKAMEISSDGGRPSHEKIESLREDRLAYEELRLSFEALQRAIERGYATISK